MTERAAGFPAKDAALRDDVRTLGALVGEMLREQGGEALYARVEAARRAAIRRRNGEPDAEPELAAALGALPAGTARELVRAFSTYFQVVNLAEKVHRIRRRRDYLRAAAGPQPGSLAQAVRALHDAGLDLEGTAELLGRLRIEPVFTAHPTEATRRTLLGKQQRIARWLVDRLDPSRTPPEEAAILARVRGEVTAGWQTEDSPGERPTVMDELEHVLFFLTDVIYRIVPPFYEALEDALAEVHGPAARLLQVPPILRFASWVGGDMDGNPNVTADTVKAALARQRQLVLGRYRRELVELYHRLSQSASQVPVDPAIGARSAHHRRLLPAAAAGLPPRHRDMPYRVLLHFVHARLAATERDAPGAYAEPAELLADLELIAASLAANRGAHAGLFAVRRTIRRVETFGFHLASLDVRQDSLVHRRAAGRLLGDDGWLERPAAERLARLRDTLAGGAPPPAAADAEAQRVLAVFAALADCRLRFGREAVGVQVVSMTQGADDLATVLLLARWGGLEGVRGEVPLDVAPLFETVADLEAAPRIMAETLADPIYRAHLASRGGRQMVMVGYSDSNKDGGLAASRWAVHEAQAALVEVFARHGVEVTFFHGRGGTISRGGGARTHRAVAAAPAGSVRGHLRMTEQGETVNAQYGLRAIAQRTLERTTGAVALATALDDGRRRPREPWRDAMATVATASRAAYRRLVYEEAVFHDYFRLATPIDVIERLPIGSRPASRRAGRGIEDLRAIPWVFAWTQSRHLLPGWFGLGSGLAAARSRLGAPLLREMASGWPFFRNLLDDVEMVLAIADLAIAERYAALAGDAGRRIFPRIRDELALTTELVLALQGSDELLADDPTLARSIRLRNPYVDPMSLLQVELLARWRAGGRRDDELLQALLSTVNGIAQGLQSTG